jgi:hypothetical protein
LTSCKPVSFSRRTLLHGVSKLCVYGRSIQTQVHYKHNTLLHFKHFSYMIRPYKFKGKGHPRTGYEGPEVEYRYTSTLSLTSALDGVGSQRHVPAVLSPGKNRYPLYRRLGGRQDRSGRVRKISSPSAFEPRTVQPVANRYTD